jgi:hypothetical protein
MPNWFCGLVRAWSRWVTSLNSSAPCESNSRLTTHSLVTAPVEVVRRPEDAVLIRSPSTSTGPRMYFTVPEGSQVTRAVSGSLPPPPVRFAGSVQSSSSNFACTAGVM